MATGGDDMAQLPEIAALRKRLRSHKYYGVQIERYGPDRWMVKAIEPLAGFGVQREMSLDDIRQSMR